MLTLLSHKRLSEGEVLLTFDGLDLMPDVEYTLYIHEYLHAAGYRGFAFRLIATGYYEGDRNKSRHSALIKITDEGFWL